MLCRFYQWKISRLADDNITILPGGLRRHLNHCPDCRIFYQTSMDLTVRLQSEAVFQRKEISKLLLDQILNSVNQAESENKPVAARSSRAVWISAAAAMVLIIFALIVTMKQPATTPETIPERSEQYLAINNLEHFIPSNEFIAQEISPQNLPEIWSQFMEEPLRKEVDGILRETTAAFNFVRNVSSLSIPDKKAEPIEDK
ncbi:MAG: hypothetical protein AMJ79_11035 [Phycisphaerae bacterium SM23_30]|nr:MAG: hypothetical protein AMJ79_11035 [Phycisphaerae bacterium SM23_30]